MPERWIAEAEDLKASGSSGVMEGGTPRVTWHVTVSPSGGSWFEKMHDTLTAKKAEPHVLYDPLTDRLGQYFPLDRSARALENDGTRRTNGHGSVNIQVEVVAMPDGFTRYWRPGPNFQALLRAIRSWGVPDVWPAGRLARTGSDPVPRSWAAYSKAGHFGHCHVPGNSHWDPGPIDVGALLRLPQTTTTPQEGTMAEADAQKVIGHINAVLLNGYTTGGNAMPSIRAILVENQRRITSQGAQLAGLTAAVKALAEAKGADANAITTAVVAAATKAVDVAVDDALAGLEITLAPKAP